MVERLTPDTIKPKRVTLQDITHQEKPATDFLREIPGGDPFADVLQSGFVTSTRAIPKNAAVEIGDMVNGMFTLGLMTTRAMGKDIIRAANFNTSLGEYETPDIPIDVITSVGKAYDEDYRQYLLNRDPKGFAQNIAERPVSYGLDAATLASLTGKLGSRVRIAAVVGAGSSRLASVLGAFNPKISKGAKTAEEAANILSRSRLRGGRERRGGLEVYDAAAFRENFGRLVNREDLTRIPKDEKFVTRESFAARGGRELTLPTGEKIFVKQKTRELLPSRIEKERFKELENQIKNLDNVPGLGVDSRVFVDSIFDYHRAIPEDAWGAWTRTLWTDWAVNKFPNAPLFGANAKVNRNLRKFGFGGRKEMTQATQKAEYLTGMMGNGIPNFFGRAFGRNHDSRFFQKVGDTEAMVASLLIDGARSSKDLDVLYKYFSEQAAKIKRDPDGRVGIFFDPKTGRIRDEDWVKEKSAILSNKIDSIIEKEYGKSDKSLLDAIKDPRISRLVATRNDLAAHSAADVLELTVMQRVNDLAPDGRVGQELRGRIDDYVSNPLAEQNSNLRELLRRSAMVSEDTNKLLRENPALAERWGIDFNEVQRSRARFLEEDSILRVREDGDPLKGFSKESAIPGLPDIGRDFPGVIRTHVIQKGTLPASAFDVLNGASDLASTKKLTKRLENLSHLQKNNYFNFSWGLDVWHPRVIAETNRIHHAYILNMRRALTAMASGRILSKNSDLLKSGEWVVLTNSKLEKAAQEMAEYLNFDLRAIFGSVPEITGFSRSVDEFLEAAQPRRSGEVFAIHKSTFNELFTEFSRSNNFFLRFIDNAQDFWRKLVLPLRPAWMVNSLIGQMALLIATHGLVNTSVNAMHMFMGGKKDRFEAEHDWDTIRHNRNIGAEQFSGGEPFGKRALAFNDDAYAIQMSMPEILWGMNRANFSPVMRSLRQMTDGESAAGVALKLRGTGMSKEVAQQLRDAGSELGNRFNRGTAVLSQINSIMSDDYPRRLSAYIETRNAAKILSKNDGVSWKNLSTAEKSSYINRILSDEKARHDISRKVINDLVDFDDLSHAERAVVRRAFPFWSWIKGSTNRFFTVLDENPAKLWIWDNASEYYSYWWEERFGTPPPSWAVPYKIINSDDADTVRFVKTEAWNPFAAPGDIINAAIGEPRGPSQPLASLGPVAKVPLEGLLNVDIFTRRPLLPVQSRPGLLEGLTLSGLSAIPQTGAIFRTAQKKTEPDPITLPSFKDALISQFIGTGRASLSRLAEARRKEEERNALLR